jgi:membrane-bound lytic murein transglycosylase B
MKTKGKKSPGSRPPNNDDRRIGIVLKTLPLFLLFAFAPPAFAHEGGTDALSCHSDHGKIGFHCHAQCEALLSFSVDLEPPTTSPHQTAAPQIYAAQVMLKSVGIEIGTADGIFGPKTHKGVEVFQSGAGLPVDGQIDERLLAQLATVAQCEAPDR